MPPLENQRQERFCALYFASQGTNTPAYDCAIQAGYSLKAARSVASRMLTFENIRARLAELNEKAERALIADVVERKRVATEIIRGRVIDYLDDKGNLITDRKILRSAALAEVKTVRRTIGENIIDTETTIKLRNPLDGVETLNKMERIGTPDNVIKVSVAVTEVEVRLNGNS